MTTFGLVHGAYHGSWCWKQLTVQLERRGHLVLTVDLPCEDPDAGAADYADVAAGAFDGAPTIWCWSATLSVDSPSRSSPGADR